MRVKERRVVTCPHCQKEFELYKEGENKILSVLKDGPKSFSEMNYNCSDSGILSNSALSAYLKSLQKSGEIERDIDTRKYHLAKHYIAK